MNIYVEGNIGSGKSTFIDIFSKELSHKQNYSFITEPVDEWLKQCDENGKNILERFYDDQHKWSYAFQMNSFISRIHRIEQNRSNINIIERSVFTDRHCFAKNCYESGKMNKIEYDIYCKWSDWLVDTFDINPTGYIYLHVSPEICCDRINNRSREGEGGIPVEYLQNLHDNHEEWLYKINKNVPVLTLDLSHDYINDTTEINTISNKIIEFIESLYSLTK